MLMKQLRTEFYTELNYCIRETKVGKIKCRVSTKTGTM